MLGKILQFLPEQATELVRAMKSFTRSLPYRGKGRWCPVCERSSRKFRAEGVILREDSQCYFCKSRERHRLVWLYFNKMTNLFDGTPKLMLHVAPEQCLEDRLKNRLGLDYLTADLMNPHAMVKMDITAIQYPDEYFDVIYCSHVLEHVQEDRKAMREFHRVLKRSGWAILLVPITAEKTFEDPSIVEPSERLRVFGQDDHVRRYGPDYIERLREAGFNVTVDRVTDLFEKNNIVRMGLTSASGDIYFCTKVLNESAC